MRPRPFHRSRLLWLGVPGLVFLLWVWWDSGGRRSYAMWVRGNGFQQGEVQEGYVAWTSGKYGSTPGKVSYSVVQRYERSDRTSAFSVARRRQFDLPVVLHRGTKVWIDGARKSEILTVRVALWAIVAGYLAAWFGMDFWWQRRKRRMMKDLTELKPRT